MNLMKLIRPDLVEFKPYRSARDEANSGEVFLNANESPWEQVYNELILNRYPTKQDTALVSCTANLYGVRTQQVGLFRGSDEAIDLLIRLFCRADVDAILQCPPTFGMYAVYAKLQGAKVINVPLLLEDFALDIAAIHQSWAPEVKLIFLCSPNNPTGQVLQEDKVLELCQHYSGKSMIVIDEAYIEFADQLSFSRYLDEYPNLAILRTLSKAYGLAGARLGALLGSTELVGYMKAILAPYPLPLPTIDAVKKALKPQRLKVYQEQIAIIKAERSRLIAFLKTLPAIETVYASDANFILIKFKNAQEVMQNCKAAGIILRDMSTKPGLTNCVRMSVGTPHENTQLMEALQ